MTATIHPLFPESAEARGAAAHPLVAALSAEVLERLEEPLRRMFDTADDRLFELSERAPNDTERRRYFDTMRVVRLERARISRVFVEQLAAGFSATAAVEAPSPAEFDLESLSIQPTEELEERIALSNMAAKAEGQHRSILWEIERRLEIAQRELRVPVSTQALNPSRLCTAFGSAAASLDTDFGVKLVIYKLFDRTVMQGLEPVFAAALAVLDRHGIRNSRRSAPVGGSAASSPISTPPPAPDRGLASSAPPSEHPQYQSTLELLRRHGLDPSSLMGSGDAAAAELGTSLQTLLGLPSLAAVQASTQRLSMASRLFDELLTGPLLPQSLRPALDDLRYPAYRAALTDARFLTDAEHPLRQRIAERIEQVLAVLTGDAPPPADGSATAPPAAADAQPATGGFGFTTLAGARQLPVAEIERFTLQLREHARNLRETLLLRVRRQVAEELAQHTGPREVPPPVQTLLRSGVGPLMAVRMLRDGRASEPFQDAERLLDRILDSLDIQPPPQPPQLADRERLTGDIADAFSDIGMAADKIENLLEGLLQVYAELDRSEPEPAPIAVSTPGANEAEKVPPSPAAAPDAADGLPRITAMELLSRVLTPESWFRVYDAAHEQTRWLKLSSFYAQQDSVTFSGFDEANRLVLHASRFADDLALGYSEPVNPTAAAREALEQLRHARAHGLL